MGKIHTDQWSAILISEGWQVEGDYWGKEIVQSSLDRMFAYGDGDGLPGVRSLRKAGKYHQARMEQFAKFDPEHEKCDVRF